MSDLSNLKQFSQPCVSWWGTIPGVQRCWVQEIVHRTDVCISSGKSSHCQWSVIGQNTTQDGDEVWMFSPSTQLDRDGNWVECNNSQFFWLPSANGLEGEKWLHCTICTPLDDGEALKDLYDEPNAPQLYSNLKECRIKASASAGVFIRLSTGFTSDDAQMLLRGDLFTNTAALYQNNDDNLHVLFPQGIYRLPCSCFIHAYTAHCIVTINFFFTACRLVWSCWAYMLGLCMHSDGATGHGRLLQHQ